MARITVEDCLEVVNNRFELVMMASKRARQLANGVQATLDNSETEDKPTVLALREIAARRIDNALIDEVEKAERERAEREALEWAAAEVVAELRQRLSDSLVRDTSLLEERAQLLGTVGSLMESIQATSSAQRTAVDQLIENAAGLMQRTGERFAEQVDAQADTLQALVGSVADAATGSRELAAGLDGAVTAFTATSSSLSAHLEQLAGALDASLARSDDQLAYYVAQAREVVDLSLLSQKQITEELRQLGNGRTPAGNA